MARRERRAGIEDLGPRERILGFRIVYINLNEVLPSNSQINSTHQSKHHKDNHTTTSTSNTLTYTSPQTRTQTSPPKPHSKWSSSPPFSSLLPQPSPLRTPSIKEGPFSKSDSASLTVVTAVTTPLVAAAAVATLAVPEVSAKVCHPLRIMCCLGALILTTLIAC